MAKLYTLVPKYVTMPAANGAFKYAFLTRSDMTGTVELGHKDAEEIAGAIFGANAPKPPRVRQERPSANTVVSTFCEPAKLKNAKKNKWQPISGLSYRGARTAGKRKAYEVPLSTIYSTVRYGQYLDANTAVEALKYGATLIDGTSAPKTIWGSSSHKPAKARKKTDSQSFSFFIQEDKMDDAAGDGYSVIGPEGI